MPCIWVNSYGRFESSSYYHFWGQALHLDLFKNNLHLTKTEDFNVF
jgi:hypothetical protein